MAWQLASVQFYGYSVILGEIEMLIKHRLRGFIMIDIAVIVVTAYIF